MKDTKKKESANTMFAIRFEIEDGGTATIKTVDYIKEMTVK